ncbi:hypothetical protein, partial [Nitrosomonas sp.]|uniref:hypothetical protein n=1 Tax=Nitrosomonas sp. TaxID=42353 RepID=UPI00272FA2B3
RSPREYTFTNACSIKEALIKLITFMVRQAHHERNQYITVRPEPVEGLDQSFIYASEYFVFTIDSSSNN